MTGNEKKNLDVLAFIIGKATSSGCGQFPITHELAYDIIHEKATHYWYHKIDNFTVRIGSK